MLIVTAKDGRISITTQEGAEVKSIAAMNLEFRPGDIVRANIVALVSDVDVAAVPYLSEDALKTAAEAYGYELVRKE